MCSQVTYLCTFFKYIIVPLFFSKDDTKTTKGLVSSKPYLIYGFQLWNYVNVLHDQKIEIKKENKSQLYNFINLTTVMLEY